MNTRFIGLRPALLPTEGRRSVSRSLYRLLSLFPERRETVLKPRARLLDETNNVGKNFTMHVCKEISTDERRVTRDIFWQVLK